MRACFAVLLAVLAVGCSGQPYRLAPVSGKVTLNGKPLARAYVHFAPIGIRNHNPGPTSQGLTDGEGRFTLTVDQEGRPAGAVVGTSKVYITTAGADAKDNQPDAGVKTSKERVPARYNQDTTLTYDVPAGGTDAANFDLKAP
jgi:hypothetical protein